MLRLWCSLSLPPGITLVAVGVFLGTIHAFLVTPSARTESVQLEAQRVDRAAKALQQLWTIQHDTPEQQQIVARHLLMLLSGVRSFDWKMTRDACRVIDGRFENAVEYAAFRDAFVGCGRNGFNGSS